MRASVCFDVRELATAHQTHEEPAAEVSVCIGASRRGTTNRKTDKKICAFLKSPVVRGDSRGGGEDKKGFKLPGVAKQSFLSSAAHRWGDKQKGLRSRQKARDRAKQAREGRGKDE